MRARTQAIDCQREKARNDGRAWVRATSARVVKVACMQTRRVWAADCELFRFFLALSLPLAQRSVLQVVTDRARTLWLSIVGQHERMLINDFLEFKLICARCAIGFTTVTYEKVWEIFFASS